MASLPIAAGWPAAVKPCPTIACAGVVGDGCLPAIPAGYGSKMGEAGKPVNNDDGCPWIAAGFVVVRGGSK